MKKLLLGLAALGLLSATPAAADNKRHHRDDKVKIYVNPYPYHSYRPYGYQYRSYDRRGYYGPLWIQYNGLVLCRERGRLGVARDRYYRPLSRFNMYSTPRSRIICDTRYY